MIPRVFVSSTVADLHHLRDSIREVVEDLSYIPVMSEYGDIGFSPTTTAVESCYRTMRECQLAVFIVGKRYGTVAEDGKSISHHEFLVAHNERVPIISLVDHEIWTFKNVWDANPDTPIQVPGVDDPKRLFGMVAEVSSLPRNNAMIPYSSVQEARAALRKQLAHIFGDLLRMEFDPVRATVADVLSELKTLQRDLVLDRSTESKNYLHAVRLLLSDETPYKNYRFILEKITGDLDKAVESALQSASFADLVGVLRATLEVAEGKNVLEIFKIGESKNWFSSAWLVPSEDERTFGAARVVFDKNRVLHVTKAAINDLERVHRELRGENSGESV